MNRLTKADVKAVRAVSRAEGHEAGAWHLWGLWTERYREANPDDERDDYELIEVYAEERDR